MTTTTENQTAKTKQVPDFYICAQHNKSLRRSRQLSSTLICPEGIRSNRLAR